MFDKRHQIIKTLLKEVDCNVNAQKIGITFKETGVRLEFDSDVKKSRHVTKWHKEVEITKQPKIRNTLVFAHQLQDLINKGRIKSSQQASEWLKISQARFDHILSLLYLSPAIQEEIITGDERNISLIPEYKLRSLAAEFEWDKQAQLWQEIKHTSTNN